MIKIYYPHEVRKKKKREYRVKVKRSSSKHAPELSCKSKKEKCFHYVS